MPPGAGIVCRSVARAADVVSDELASVHLRRWFTGSLANHLPMYSLARVRLALWRAAGVDVGDGTTIGGRLWVGGGPRAAERLHIGTGCFVNDGCRFDLSADIHLGDGVYLGHEVALITATHRPGASVRRAGELASAPISIGQGAWVGARATILAGVTIGAGAVVAAGAVVTRPVEPSVLVGGVPARLIRALD